MCVNIQLFSSLNSWNCFIINCVCSSGVPLSRFGYTLNIYKQLKTKWVHVHSGYMYMLGTRTFSVHVFIYSWDTLIRYPLLQLHDKKILPLFMRTNYIIHDVTVTQDRDHEINHRFSCLNFPPTTYVMTSKCATITYLWSILHVTLLYKWKFNI